MKCISCNSSNLETIKSGPHNALVCKDCLKFQKFLSKKDTSTFNMINKEKEKPIMKLIKIKLVNKLKMRNFMIV